MKTKDFGSGGPTGGAIASGTAGCIASEAKPLTVSQLAELVRNAGPDVHADPFSQARFLVDCGLLVAAAATARAGVEAYVCQRLPPNASVSRMERRVLPATSAQNGSISRPAGARLSKLQSRLNEFVRGQQRDVDELLSIIEAVAAMCDDRVAD